MRKVIVSQVRSGIGQTKEVKRTLQALGLGRIGKRKEHTLSPSVSGMVKAVSHLVELTEI